MYVHENNILNKIHTNYNSKANELQTFYTEEYLPMRSALTAITFSENDLSAFEQATDIINAYCQKLHAFAIAHNIRFQSKFESTFLEEISVYLFKDLPEIASNEFGVYNKKIYAGLKIDTDKSICIITKDVDFCIGKMSHLSIDGRDPVSLILPVVAVEVKTYLDATMFGEIKSSSKAIRSATPNSKTYVLMGYKSLGDEHIIAARQDSTLSEMFVLRENENAPISADAMYQYWKEIAASVHEVAHTDTVQVPGKLLRA